MYPPSPPYQCPPTPSALRIPLTYKPLNSSPLVCSPGTSKSSPLVAAQARRRSQYKALTPSTPTPTRILSKPRNVRDRLKTQCLERAANARAKAIKGKRCAIDLNSDDFTMDYDEEEEDEDIMKDELFRRIMANTTRKEHHSYRISYAQEVGSSFDPDLEDVDTWEKELTASGSVDPNVASTPRTSSSLKQSRTEDELTPVDLDDEELEAYAEECAQRAALADFDDIPEEELFSWGDFEEFDELVPHSGKSQFEGYDMDTA